MAEMPDNCVDLIATDPPYFRVKGEAWDRQWDSATKFLAWLDSIAAEWQRILKPNGSLYCFASPKMAARVEVMLGARFCVLNRIAWKKHDGTHNEGGLWSRASKESLRRFFEQKEEIIFAEHHGADNIAKGEAGYVAKCDELRGFVFEPLRAYLAGERDRAGFLSSAAVDAEWQRMRGTKGCMAGHWFGVSQWELPTAKNYQWLRDLFGGDYLRREYEDLRREYEDLRREYEDLRREYEDLRRPFSVSADVPYTDVWTFPTVPHRKGKHICEKPLEMMLHIIRASSRPGAVVFDSFTGSGVVGEAAVMLGREFIGHEMDPRWVESARARVGGTGGKVLPFVVPRRIEMKRQEGQGVLPFAAGEGR
jgi:site-specific DNA-methyltransferase (adenine-specific)